MPAFDKARETATLEPLRSVVPGHLLDADEHILRGRRYLLFGPDERKLIGVGRLLTGALRQASSSSLEAGEHTQELADAVTASGRYPEAALRWSRLLQPDHGLPRWMIGDLGPSVVGPDETSMLATDLEAFAELPVVQDDEALEAHVRDLSAFLQADRGAANAWISH